MDTGDHFQNRGHAHGIGPDGTKEACFRRRFKTRAQDAGIHPLFEGDTQLQGLFSCKSHQVSVINPAHVRKPWSKIIEIGADQGIPGGQVQVVRHHHQVSGLKERIQSARCTGDDQGPGPEP